MKRLVALVFAVICFAACQKAPFLTMTGSRSYTFTREGGSQTLAFSCNRDWIVSSSESWIQISPSSGSASDGDISVTITCSPNDTYDPRTATLTVKVEELVETISVSQETGIGLIVSPTSYDLTNAEQTIEIEVQQNVNYSIEIDDACKDWIKNSSTKALTTDKVVFSIAANESYDSREGKITFKQLEGDLFQTVTVLQSQTNGLFITTPDYNLSNEAHNLSVEVKANVEFEVTSQAEWIKVVETKALTPSTVTLSIEANESYDNRTGTVLVKQTNGDLTGTITVTQKQTDYLSITPTSFDLTNAAQRIEIKVNDNVSYNVVIPDDAKEWLSLSSNTQTKAIVEDKVVLALSANATYDKRETSVTIKQTDGSLAETISIKQAYGEGLLVEKTEYEVTNAMQTLDVEVKANVEFEVSSDVEWIQYVETKALTTSSVTLSISANEGFENRKGTVTIKQKNGSLSKQVTIVQQQTDFITIDAAELNVTDRKQTLNISLSTNCEYNISANVDWITHVPDETTTSSLIVLSIAANEVSESRTGEVTVTNKQETVTQTITITQQAFPKIVTLSASAVGIVSSTLNGSVTADPVAYVGPRGFIYSDTATTLDALKESGTAIPLTNVYANDFSKELYPIHEATKYYYVTYAVVNSYTYYGEVKTFTTLDYTPGEAVDLGLSVRWSSVNLGAFSPEEIGVYFAWGETEPKAEYSWKTYKWGNPDNGGMTKYNTDSTYGTVDGKTHLDLEDDAAHVKLKGAWRIPTQVECNELINNCTWLWATVNGKEGYEITSNINGNKIFLPAVANYGASSDTFGTYLTSDLRLAREAWRLTYYKDYLIWTDSHYLYWGMAIRPVM